MSAPALKCRLCGSHAHGRSDCPMLGCGYDLDLDLKGAEERLCRAQVNLDPATPLGEMAREFIGHAIGDVQAVRRALSQDSEKGTTSE